MILYFIRHAEKTDPLRNDKEMSLTERGFLQAALLGERMRTVKLEHIYCSDMLRAVQTAQGLNRYIAAPITQHRELREIDLGEREGKDTKTMWEAYPAFMEKWNAHEEDVRFPGGENGEDVFLRVKPLLERIVSGKEKEVAIVSHCGLIRSVLCGLMGLPFQKRVFLGRPIEFTSITKVIYEHGHFWFDYINDYQHIAHTLDRDVFVWENMQQPQTKQV